MKHTPGPWHAVITDGLDNHAPSVSICPDPSNPRTRYVTNVPGIFFYRNPGMRAQLASDVALIVEAPYLLELVESLAEPSVIDAIHEHMGGVAKRLFNASESYHATRAGR